MLLYRCVPRPPPWRFVSCPYSCPEVVMWFWSLGSAAGSISLACISKSPFWEDMYVWDLNFPHFILRCIYIAGSHMLLKKAGALDFFINLPPLWACARGWWNSLVKSIIPVYLDLSLHGIPSWLCLLLLCCDTGRELARGQDKQHVTAEQQGMQQHMLKSCSFCWYKESGEPTTMTGYLE